MDIERLIGSVIQGAVASRGKRSKKALRALGGGKGSVVNARTLLAAAGLAWGVYETIKSRSEAGPAAAAPPGLPPPQPSAPPPLPSAAPASLPTLPASAPVVSGPPLPDGVLRIVRLAISAARADGELSAAERELILARAREAGAEAQVKAELERSLALPDIVGGAGDAAERHRLYQLAFSIVRADESVTGAERIYLAQLAHRLGLDAAAAQALEREAAAAIDGSGDLDGDLSPAT